MQPPASRPRRNAIRAASLILHAPRPSLPPVPGGHVYHYALDAPPSVNNLYPSSGDRRIVSAEYATWKDAASWVLKACYPGYEPPDHDPCWMLFVTLTVPDWRKRDLDGKLKALIDLLAEWFRLDDNRLLLISAEKRVVAGQYHIAGDISVDADADA